MRNASDLTSFILPILTNRAWLRSTLLCQQLHRVELVYLSEGNRQCQPEEDACRTPLHVNSIPSPPASIQGVRGHCLTQAHQHHLGDACKTKGQQKAFTEDSNGIKHSMQGLGPGVQRVNKHPKLTTSAVQDHMRTTGLRIRKTM